MTKTKSHEYRRELEELMLYQMSEDEIMEKLTDAMGNRIFRHKDALRDAMRKIYDYWARTSKFDRRAILANYRRYVEIANKTLRSLDIDRHIVNRTAVPLDQVAEINLKNRQLEREIERIAYNIFRAGVMTAKLLNELERSKAKTPNDDQSDLDDDAEPDQDDWSEEDPHA